MSWDALAPRRGPTTSSPMAPVKLGCIAAGGRYTQFCSLLVRPALLDGGLPFWMPGQRVTVELGAGEHAGLLRVRMHATGLFCLRGPGGHSTKGAAVLRLPALAGMSELAHKSAPVEHDWSNTWLEITLPEWARPAVVKDPDGHDVRRTTPPPAVRVAPGVPVPSKGNPFAVPKVARDG